MLKGQKMKQVISCAIFRKPSLNQSCTTTDQCSGNPYASCLGGKCSCIEGYAASSSSDCVLGMSEFKY